MPTASLGAIELLAPEVDEIVCLNVRSSLSFAVAEAYENWHDLSDEEVLKLLKEKLKAKPEEPVWKGYYWLSCFCVRSCVIWICQ